MSGDAVFAALTALFAGTMMLLGAKLHRMLFREGSYWAGGSPWYIDKRAAPGDHAFFVAVIGIAFLVSLGMTALFLLAALHAYF